MGEVALVWLLSLQFRQCIDDLPRKLVSTSAARVETKPRHGGARWRVQHTPKSRIIPVFGFYSRMLFLSRGQRGEAMSSDQVIACQVYESNPWHVEKNSVEIATFHQHRLPFRAPSGFRIYCLVFGKREIPDVQPKRFGPYT